MEILEIEKSLESAYPHP